MAEAPVSVRLKNVEMKGVNFEAFSAQQYFKVSGKTLFRRLLYVFAVIFALVSWVAYASNKSLKEWTQEQVVLNGLASRLARLKVLSIYILAGILTLGLWVYYSARRSIQVWNDGMQVISTYPDLFFILHLSTLDGKATILTHPTEGLEILKQHTLPRAFHDSDNRLTRTNSFDSQGRFIGTPGPPRCHPSTRRTILEDVHKWATQPNSNSSLPIFWLHGIAGTGKSAIAQTLSERWHEEGRLGASFFFAEGSTNPDEGKRVAATIAYQLQFSLGDRYRASVGKAVQEESSILKKSMESQIHELISQPLADRRKGPVSPMMLLLQRISNRLPSILASQTSEVEDLLPKIIVIDGLDEVLDANSQCQLIESLASEILQQKLPLRLLVSSRTQTHLLRTFDGLKASTSVLSLSHHESNAQDVEEYIRAELDGLHFNVGMFSQFAWFGGSLNNALGLSSNDEVVPTLARQAAGNFAQAAIAVAFIKAPGRNPTNALLDWMMAVRARAHFSSPTFPLSQFALYGGF